ncbi:MAG: tetratricopeptide repeat protein [Bacteroidales bacterium]|nr:tetratricopeptide repeat protein [Bacteroidales bacterium]
MNRTHFCLIKTSIVFALLLLTSCAPVRDRRTLNDMEVLMPERPDSALAVLRGLQPRDLPGLHVRPLHALLLSEAFDKNYIDLTDDSLAIAANRYYGDHGTKLHRLKSWYYLGRIRFNSGNYAEAVICYDKALEYAESLTNYHYMGLINREISSAYSRVWDDKHAIEYMRRSSECFQCINENRYLEYNQLALSRLYRRVGKANESQVLLDSLLSVSDDKYLIAEAYRTAASLSSADSIISPYLTLEYFRKARESSLVKMSASDYSNLALAYARLRIPDSSSFYLEKAYHSIRTTVDSLAVEYDKYRIADYEGDYKLANKLLEHSVFAQDSIVQYVLGQSISFYQGNYYQNESRMNALKARMRALSYGIVILLLFLLALYLLSKNSKQRAMIVEEMARTSEVQQDLLTMCNENMEIGRAVATLFENRLNILQKLSDRYDMIDERYQQKNRENKRELTKDEIVDSFRNMMRDLRKDKDINISMEEILDSWKGGIMRKFRNVFGEDSPSGIRMSEEDFELAPYYFSGMKPKAISFLTGHSEHALRERKRRIKQRINYLNDTYSEEKVFFLSNL